MIFVLEGLVEPHDKGVIQFSENIDLFLQVLRVDYFFFDDDFDNPFAVRRVYQSGLIDYSEGSSA